MATAYVETTIPSYLTSRSSRDLVIAAHQQLTQEWWDGARQEFELVISQAVVDEIRAGDISLSARRLEIIRELPVLGLNDAVRSLAGTYSKGLGLHPGAATDVLHIAYAVAYEVDYLVTWNCRHIANGHVIRRLQQINRKAEMTTPVIVTPEELLVQPLGDSS
jgi:predicted nucleic acid-binding protein